MLEAIGDPDYLRDQPMTTGSAPDPSLADLCASCDENLTCPTAYRRCTFLDSAE